MVLLKSKNLHVDKLKYGGLTFHAKKDECLARTNDPMSPNTFVYKIKWKIEESGVYNAVGICTDDYNEYQYKALKAAAMIGAMAVGVVGVVGEDISWVRKEFHIGWHSKGRKNHNPNGLECGGSRKHNNIFFKQCEFAGDNLPSFKKNDIVGLIYDSFSNELLFELNGKMLNSKLTKIPQNIKLFWFAGHRDGETVFSIV